MAAGLVSIEEHGSSPVSADLDTLADEAERLFARSPNAIRRMIVAHAHSGLATFADAVRLRRDWAPAGNLPRGRLSLLRRLPVMRLFLARTDLRSRARLLLWSALCFGLLGLDQALHVLAPRADGGKKPALSPAAAGVRDHHRRDRQEESKG